MAVFQWHVPKKMREWAKHCSFEEWLLHLSKARLQCSLSLILSSRLSDTQSCALQDLSLSHLQATSTRGIPGSNRATQASFGFEKELRDEPLGQSIGSQVPSYFHCLLVWSMPYQNHKPNQTFNFCFQDKKQQLWVPCQPILHLLKF